MLETMSQISHLRFHLKKLKKEDQIEFKTKKITTKKAEIYDLEFLGEDKLKANYLNQIIKMIGLSGKNREDTHC